MDDKTKIARGFALLLRENLGAETMAEIVQMNETDAYASVCASHDFCDANVYMAWAFEIVLAREIDLQSDADIDLFNAAWDVSRDAGFDTAKIGGA